MSYLYFMERRIILVFLGYFTFLTSLSEASIYLTVSPSGPVEVNQNVTIQCNFDNNPLEAAFYSTASNNTFCNLTSNSSGSNCKASFCSLNYYTTCPNDTTYRVVYPVPRRWNGEGVYCKRLFSDERSNQVNFNVTVSVTSVTLTPTNITVDAGKQINLICQTDYCNPAASITWYKASYSVATPTTVTTDTNSNGLYRTTSVLQYTGVPEDNGRQVYCNASNRPSWQNVGSNKYTLDIRYPPSSDPVFTASPPGLQYNTGTTVNLTCQLPGGNPLATLSWRCKNTAMTGTNQSTFTTAVSVLPLVMDSSYNNQQCTCTANHRLLTSPKSTSVSLTVFYPPSTEPVITASPPGLQYNTGTAVNLTCQLSGGNPVATLSWRCKNTIMTGTNQSTSTTAVSLLSLVMDSSYNNQQCTCTANHRLLNSPNSRSVPLTVFYPPSTDPVIKASPPGLQYNTGTAVNLTCQILGGNPVATLSWRCKNTVMTGTNQSNSTTAVSVLSLVMNKSYNNQQCTCIASHSFLTSPKSRSVPLTVFYPPSTDPVITASPPGLQYNTGARVTLTCQLPGGNPPATLSWRCKNLVLMGTNHSTSTTAVSVLSLVMDRSYNNQPCSCTVNHSLFTNPKSTNLLLTVFYPPSTSPVITASPQGLQYVTSTRVTLICQLPGGNPVATLSWRCKITGMIGTNQSTPTTAVSVLSLLMDSSYNNQQCTCTANHGLLTIPKSTTVSLTVFYNNVIISNWNQTYSVKEHESFQLVFEVDGNPSSNITWVFVRNNSVIEKDYYVKKSSLEISSVNCLDYGTYRILADNGKGPIANKTANLLVNCKPRLFSTDSLTPAKIGIGKNESLQIFVRILLFPPAIQTTWYFSRKANDEKVITDSKDGYRIFHMNGDVEQNITLYKESVTTEDFGNYTLRVENEIGAFSRIYNVNSTRPPLLPTNFTVLCENSLSIKISWISNFNGGDEQSFQISYSTDEFLTKPFKVLKPGIGDKGYNKTHSYIPIVELQGPLWFAITASNKFGNVTSDVMYCTAVKSQVPDSNIPVGGIIGGTMGGVISVVLVVCVIFFNRKYQIKCVVEEKRLNQKMSQKA
ncbi:synaptogenesis protein syg-2-like [Saccostrea cucullata]|uniref:synaptogenesis protein syg-2-like n=1 Tax=Saccostrea cuccullata TaxID=36930 RepID=UPI002ED243B2